MADYQVYVEGLIQKDEQAFEYIYHNTKTSVYAVIVAIVKDKDISQDLMQDTYITMIEKIHQYKKGHNFLNWLLTIAKNKAIDYYRRKNKEILLDNLDLEVILPKTPPKGERNALLSEMLDLLTENERQVFLLHIMQNIPHRDIAKIMKIPLGTSLWYYQKAIKKINKMKGSDEHET